MFSLWFSFALDKIIRKQFASQLCHVGSNTNYYYYYYDLFSNKTIAMGITIIAIRLCVISRKSLIIY